jgi:hypothetical protein
VAQLGEMGWLSFREIRRLSSREIQHPTDDPKELQFAEPTQGIFNFFSFFPDSGLIVMHKSYKSPNADGPYISMGWGKCK